MKTFIAAIFAAGMLATAVSAAPSSITLDQPNPAFGDQVTFTVTLPRPTDDGPFVQVDCFQSGELVSRQTLRATETFTLGPTTLWTGGAADCEATALRYNGHKGLLVAFESITFSVSV